MMVETAATENGVQGSNLRGGSEQASDQFEYKTPQRSLLLALESRDILAVRHALSRIPVSKQNTVLLAPSKRPKHQLRTPLMAAAASGDMAIIGAVFEGFNRIFRGDSETDNATKIQLRKDRNRAMKTQLELADIGGATLLMIAASTASVSVFNAVAHEIRPSQVRKILPLQDARGMTFLMYAVNPEAMLTRPIIDAANLLTAEQGLSEELSDKRHSMPLPLTQSAPLSTELDANGGEDPLAARSVLDDDRTQEEYNANPWVPVVKSVLGFAKKNLWMPEYLELLKIRDSWERTIIEHSIVSGRNIVFDAVFDSIREDIYDEENRFDGTIPRSGIYPQLQGYASTLLYKQIEHLLEIGEDTEYEQTAMRVAVNSVGGRKVANLVSSKYRQLKKDVSFRKEDSTVTSKIQAFIPANLIVIFQLLLPQINEDSYGPLILLGFLCCVAPLWAWGASLVTTTHPERKNTLARVTWARHVLAFPSMFFWGVGTSSIGETSFGWDDSMSAAALAVATIVIPALDSFASGKGARSFYGIIVINMLDIYNKVKTNIPLWFRTKKLDSQARNIEKTADAIPTLKEGMLTPDPWLYDDDDEWQTPEWVDQAREMGVTSVGVNTSPFNENNMSFSTAMDSKDELQEVEARASNKVVPMVATSVGRVVRGVKPFEKNHPSRVQPSTLEVDSEEKSQDGASDL